ncbi:MAG: porin [Massilia sp.]
MKPSVFALALLGSSMGSAWAQSSGNVHGVLDAGLVDERGCAGCGPRVASGVASQSRLGVSGSETLGDTIAAVFALEAGLLIDNGRSAPSGKLFGRQAYVGLQGKLGTVTVGRHLNLDYLTVTDVADPFQGGMAGSATNLIGGGDQGIDNSIQYVSRPSHGLSARAVYSPGETVDYATSSVGNSREDRAWGVSIGFEKGPLTLRAAHQNRHVTQVAPAMPVGNRMDAKNSIIAANVRLGPGIAYAAYSSNRGWGSSPLWNPDNPYGAAIASSPSTDSRDVLVGFALPRGATTLLASFIRKNDRDLANRDADQLAFGGTYALSRQTDFYAAWSRIRNRNGAGYTVGNASDAGRGSSALNLGMRHAF